LPQGMAAKGLYDHLAIVAEIDRKHGVIVNAQCTLITNLANNAINNVLKGYCLQDGIDPLISEVIDFYHGAARNAIIASLKDLYREYLKFTEE
jgi:phage gp29-like protein